MFRFMTFLLRSVSAVVVAGAFAWGTSGCDVFPSAPDDSEILDGFIEGLTPSQVAVHIQGDEEFGRVFAPDEGLGPLFVTASCATCHPGDGKGHPVFNLTRFGRMVDGVFDPMRAQGGPQLQHRAVPGYAPERLPSGHTGAAGFTAPAVTGLGVDHDGVDHEGIDLPLPPIPLAPAVAIGTIKSLQHDRKTNPTG